MPTITRFQQAAFTVTSGNSVLAVDIGSYVTPEFLQQVGHPAAALVSHIHGDHFLEANLLAMGAPVYTVGEVAQAIENASLGVHIQRHGDQVEIPDSPFSVRFLPSDHGPNVGPVEQAAFLIEAEGKVIYFLADMYNPAPFPATQVDVVLIPVGGAGYTFDVEMAAQYLRSNGWKGLTVPIHYDNPRMDPLSGKRLADAMGGDCDVRVLGLGESLPL